MKKTRTRLWSLLLTVAMLLTMLPATALAEGENLEESTTGTTQESTTPETKVENPVARLESKGEEFETLQAAIDAAEDGDTVTLLEDVDNGDGIIIESGTNITIDFAGHYYYVAQNMAGSTGTATQAFQLLRDSTLVFKNGTIKNLASGGKMVIQNYANLTLENMTLDGSNSGSIGYVLSINCGEVNLTENTTITAFNGNKAFDTSYWPTGGYPEGAQVNINTTGTITGIIEVGLYGNGSGKLPIPSTSLLTIQNINHVGSISLNQSQNGTYGTGYTDEEALAIFTDKCVITGGEFSSDVSDYVAKGYVCNPSGNSYIVEPLSRENATAMVTGDSKVTYFETLTDAIAAANDGETVTLLQDFTTTGTAITIPEGKDITLDLGDNTLTMAGQKLYSEGSYLWIYATLFNNGVLTVQNGTIKWTGSVSGILNTGTLNIASDAKLENTFGTYYKSNGYAPPCVYLIVNVGGDVTTAGTLTSVANNGIVTYGGTVSVSGGSISAPNAEAVCIDIFNRNDNNTSAGADVTISGGELEAGSLVASTNNQKSGGEDGCNLTVTGGTLTAGRSTIYWPSSGTLIIGTEGSDQGPTLTCTGGPVVLVCGGTLNIYGGSLESQETPGESTTEGLVQGFRANSGYVSGISDAVTIVARRGGGYVGSPLSVTIAGGEFTANNYGVRYLDCNTAAGADQLEQDVSVSITGGSFSGALSAVDAEFVPAAEQKFITGGTFSSEVDSSYLGANCVCEKQSDGTYRVGVPVTVTFINDGTEVKTENVFAGDRVSAPADPVKEGYTFLGWYNGDTKFNANSPVTETGIYTAKWEIETYTVTFDANGGSAVEDVTVSYGDRVSAPADPVKEGYAFLGWYTEDGELYDFTAPVTSDLTLTAKWNEVVTTPGDEPAGVDEIQVAPSTPVIDDSNAPAGSQDIIDALEQEGVEQEGVTEAAKDLASNSAYMAEIAAEAKTELELGDDKNVTLVVETSLNISVTDVKEGDSFTLDITPKYTITATADGKSTVIVKEETLTVTKPVTLTIPLPKSFVDAAELFVHHLKNGRTYVYDGKVLNGKLSFLNPHGFSQFTISRTGPEASVDGVQYATLQEAVDAVENRGTITVHQSGLYAQVSGVKTFWVETDTGVEMPLLYAAPGYTLSKDGNKYTVRVRTIDDPDNDYELPTWDITVEDSDNGDVEVSPEEAKPTTTITITVTPDKGYAVAEVVVTDENGKEITVTDKGGNKYTFRMPNSDVTIEVTFQPVSGGAAGSDLTITAPTGWVNPFTDVAANAWYYDAVGYANANGLMGGTSATTFAPNGAMNRSMVWTVIARLAGQTISGANWAEDAKAWAVAQGVSDGTNPDGNVTREELVTMLYRYIGSPVMNVPELGLINSYPDAASVSDWAQNALAWALSRGIIDGRDGKLASGESVTRAEAATILARFHLLTK